MHLQGHLHRGPPIHGPWSMATSRSARAGAGVEKGQGLGNGQANRCWNLTVPTPGALPRPCGGPHQDPPPGAMPLVRVDWTAPCSRPDSWSTVHFTFHPPLKHHLPRHQRLPPPPRRPAPTTAPTPKAPHPGLLLRRCPHDLQRHHRPELHAKPRSQLLRRVVPEKARKLGNHAASAFRTCKRLVGRQVGQLVDERGLVRWWVGLLEMG